MSEQERPLRSDARRNRARILAAAREVFTERGPTATTEEVAARAGVAVGTIFRHFPTKDDLLAAIMKELRSRLAAEADALLADPAEGLFRYFSSLVEQAAATKTVVGLLAGAGVDVRPDAQIREFTDAVGRLLAQAQRAGTVRPDVELPEVMALLTSTSQGALTGGWDPPLQRRTLDIIFTGLGPPTPSSKPQP